MKCEHPYVRDNPFAAPAYAGLEHNHNGCDGMARVCRKEEGSDIWLRPKSVVDLGVGRAAGPSLSHS